MTRINRRKKLEDNYFLTKTRRHGGKAEAYCCRLRHKAFSSIFKTEVSCGAVFGDIRGCVAGKDSGMARGGPARCTGCPGMACGVSGMIRGERRMTPGRRGTTGGGRRIIIGRSWYCRN